MLTAEQRSSMGDAMARAVFDRVATRRRFFPALDRFNNEVRDESDPEDIETACQLSPNAGAEAGTDRSTVTTNWICRMPPTVDVRAADQVIIDGTTFEVDGPPQVFPSHVHVDLVVVKPASSP